MSDNDFCNLLKDGRDKANALIAAIGSPDFASKLAEVKESNDAGVAAAPAELHDALAKFYEVSEIAQRALDPSISPSEKADLTNQARTQATSPEMAAAIETYKTWVNAHCGALAAPILEGVA